MDLRVVLATEEAEKSRATELGPKDDVIDSHLALTQQDRQLFVGYMKDALTLIARGIVGFAGFTEEPRQRRLGAFRAKAMADVERTPSWLDSQDA